MRPGQTFKVAKRASADRAAVSAWLSLARTNRQPGGIETLKESKKSGVYRLLGAGPAGAPVIAKRCWRPTAQRERAIYEDVLPGTGIEALRFYGYADDTDPDLGWLFLEDAGAAQFLADAPEHRQAAARWLGVLHISTAGLGLARRLPDSGPSHYLDVLRLARASIVKNLGNTALAKEDVSLLRDVVGLLNLIEGRWRDVEELCLWLPEALVHGDFVDRNIRVRASPSGISVFPFDWEMAGWARPVTDLANVDIRAYWATVSAEWRHLSIEDVRILASLGWILRLLEWVSWARFRLKTEWASLAIERKLRYYRTWLAEALEGIGWLPGRLES